MLVSRCIKIRIILWKLILHDETERFAEIKNFFWAESKKLWERSILNFVRANLTSLWTEIYNFSLIRSNADLYPLNNSKCRMDHWWPALSIRSKYIPFTFTATTKRSNRSTLGWEAEKGKREREKNLLKLFSKISWIVESFHDSSARIEIKFKRKRGASTVPTDSVGKIHEVRVSN